MRKTILIAIAALFTVNVWGQVTDTGSKVGIGITTPKGILHVNAINEDAWVYFTNNLNGNNNPQTSYGLSFGWNYDIGSGESVINYGASIGSNPRLDFSSFDGTNYKVEMTLKNGKLGVGTINPQEKFEIKDGSIRLSNLTGVAYGSLGKIDFFNYTSAANVVSARIEGKRDSYSHKDGRLSFYTSDVDGILNEQMTIDRFGNVGIGTTTPYHLIDVGGTRIDGNGKGNLGVKTDEGGYAIYLEENSAAEGWQVGINDNGDLQFFDSQSTIPNIVFQDISCNVGIGITNPNSKLDVDGDIKINNNNFYTRNDRTIINDAPVYGFGLSNIVSGSNFYMQVGDYYGLNFVTGGDSRLTITKDGNVGIGTTVIPDGYLFAVDGKAIFEEVKVEIINGADLVFEDDYKLRKLDDLEEFVNTNKHLPEIASEKEMQEKGVDMGEFQIQLLQKIEELTLYVIELKKENDRLNEKVDALMQE